jgi:hypothetical protein
MMEVHLRGWEEKALKKSMHSIMDTGKKKAGVVILCGTLLLTVGTGLAVAANAMHPHEGNQTFQGAPVSPQEQAKLDEQRKQQIATQYAVYEKYGLSYDMTTDVFRYNEQIVRFFADQLDNEGQYVTFTRPHGEVDLRAIRNDNHELISIEPVPQEEFDRRTETMHSVKQGSSISDGEQGASQSTTNGGNSGEPFTTQVDPNPNTVDETLNAYVDFGVSYDQANRQWVFDEKPIQFLFDDGYSTYIHTTVDNGISLHVVRDDNGHIEKLVEMQ